MLDLNKRPGAEVVSGTGAGKDRQRGLRPPLRMGNAIGAGGRLGAGGAEALGGQSLPLPRPAQRGEDLGCWADPKPHQSQNLAGLVFLSKNERFTRGNSLLRTSLLFLFPQKFSGSLCQQFFGSAVLGCTVICPK